MKSKFTIMKLHLLLTLSVLLLCISACKKDDDNPSKAAPVDRTELYELVFNGDTVGLNMFTIEHSDMPESLSIMANSWAGGSFAFRTAPIRNNGNHYANDESLIFSVLYAGESWYCKSGCTFQVNEHNTALDWFDVSIYGTMTDSTETNTATLNSARIKLFY